MSLRPDPNEELRLLEEKANATYGVYKEKCDTKVRLLAENEIIVEEKKALMDEIAKSQGDMSQYHERQQKCAEQKADLEIALTEAQDKLARTEQARIQVLKIKSQKLKKACLDIKYAGNKRQEGPRTGDCGHQEGYCRH